MITEEKALEASIRTGADDVEYMRVFRLAREALYQRGGGNITECDARCVAVLREHFVLREPGA